MTTPPSTPNRRNVLRAFAPLVVMGALAILVEFSGLREAVTLDRIRALGEDAGWLGAAAFLVLCVVGFTLQIPGVIFLAGARLAFGACMGAALAYVGALAGMTVSFLFLRAVGGDSVTSMQSPRLQRLLANVQSRPVLTVLGLRTLLWMSPPLNGALALSGVGLRHYVAGTALGLVIPVVTVVLLADGALSALGMVP